MHNFAKQLLTVLFIWAIICTILIHFLFSYYENYTQKQEAKVIYEIEHSVAHIEAESESR